MRCGIRGDANSDREVDLADAISMLHHLFLRRLSSPGCSVALDVNSDDIFDISDPIFLLFFLFNGGLAIAAPYPDAVPCE